ncbi:MAG: SDR family NAD(P)-dependent oxidoreductase [Clostridia bacterium]
MNIAVVTGASSGMGREFVRLLDNEGLDEIWGIALEKELLEKVKSETKTNFKVMAFDLTDASSLIKIKNELALAKANVKWLINCSGFGKFGRYDEIPVEQSLNMILLNCSALVGLTEYSLPFMTKGARIVEIASVASFQPVPYINVYSATKSFVLNYSRALRVELKDREISVTCVCPFWTKTAFFKRAESPSNKVVSKYIALYEPTDVINKAFKDAKANKELSIFGFKARAQVRLVKMCPPKMVMSTWVKQQKLDKKYRGK